MASFLTKVLLLAGLCSLPAVQGLPTSNATKLCSDLQARYPKQIVSYGITLNATLISDYHEATTRYWSAENADNVPACVFLPTAANEVADAVVLLNKYTNVPWAVKGAGHNPNKGFSSTAGGLLIALQTIAGISFDPATAIAQVGGGARWADVQTALEPYGHAVVGGRIGDVGVSGLTLGGGLSFLSAAHGFTADTVTNYLVVTADGVVTNANATSNSDLFYALKGGGSQFAIVVTFSFQTVPIGNIWGGHRFYDAKQKDALLAATHNLVSNYSDPKAGVIVTYSSTLFDLANLFVVFYFYNDPAGPGSILSEHLSIPYLTDATSANRSFAGFLTENSQFSFNGMRYNIRTGTLPNLAGAAGLDVYNYTFNSWYNTVQPYFLSSLDNFIFSIAYQPVPSQLQQASVSSAHGGNRLGLDPKHGDLIFMEYDVSWLNPASDTIAASIISQATQPVQDYTRNVYGTVTPTHYQSGDISFTSYNPLFMNDAMYNQYPLQSYGAATFAQLKAIQKARDPNGLFNSRTGGWKYN